MIETAIVLSATMLLILAGLDLTLLLVRQNALNEGARRAARMLSVRGSKAVQLGVEGPVALEATMDSAHAICAEMRALFPTMSPDAVSMSAEWLDGSNQLDQRIKVTLRYTHRPLFAALHDYAEHELCGSSTVLIGH